MVHVHVVKRPRTMGGGGPTTAPLFLQARVKFFKCRACSLEGYLTLWEYSIDRISKYSDYSRFTMNTSCS